MLAPRTALVSTLSAAFLFAVPAADFSRSSASAAERRSPVVEVVERLSPAVVSIYTEEVVQRRNPFFGGGSIFDEFFRRYYDPAVTPERRLQSLGTGVIIDPQGIVLTNEHVVARATSIRITLASGESLSAEVVAADPRFDLAVLRVETEAQLPAAPMGRSDDLMPGETVIAIGNPFGLGHTVTTGVVSAVDRSIKTGERTFHDFIQTDASINPGNSGGPLLNINGEVIGINTAIYESGQGIGFAIPVNKARRVVDELLEYGKVRAAWLGIVPQEMDRELRASFGYSGRSRVVVVQVDPGSPAEKAGVKVGDIVDRFGRSGAGDPRELDRSAFVSAVGRLTPGDALALKVFRDGELRDISVQVGAFPKGRATELLRERTGIELRVPNRREKRILRRRGISGMIIETVRRRSTAAQLGLEPGDLVNRIAGSPIASEADVEEVMANLRLASAVPMIVLRGKAAYRVTVPVR